jgi:hypothetical protein
MMKLLEFYSLIVYNTPRDYTMKDQEKELIDGYRKLGPESKRFIMSTVITAVTAESAIKRQYGLPAENCAVGAVSQVANEEVKGA